jgi:hypothetical protein
MIGPEMVTAGIRIARAEESWIPVLFGGMIPILGAGAVFWLIWHAVKEPPEDEDDKQEGGPEDPPSDGAT